MSSATLATKQAAPAAAIGQIIAYTMDDLSGAALKAGIGDLARDFVLRRGTVYQATRFLEKNTAPDGIIVDISGVPEPAAALEGLARVCPPDVAVAVIGDSTDIGLYRQLVNEIGVTEYLPKPLNRDMVERLLLHHFMPGHPVPATPRGGHVVAVCGASGGAGATTIAVNLAVELASVAKSMTALVDLNLQHGAAALMLGARPGPGLRIALEDPAKADTLLMERAAIEVAPRLRLIAADERLESGIGFTAAGVRQVIDLIRQKFNYCIVDLPMPLRPELHHVLAAARQVIVVLRPDMVSVRNARDIRHLAISTVGADRVVTVVNQASIRGGLPRPLLEKALDSPVHASLPALGKEMVESVNLGVPAVRRVPELRTHLAPLIQEIAARRIDSPAPSWVRRWFVR